MKKFLFIFALIAIIGSGTAFADSNDNWGVGVGYLFGGTWSGREYSAGFNSDILLSLKVSGIPVYWGISLPVSAWVYGFGIGFIGDYYIINNAIGSTRGFRLYLGIGAYVNFYNETYYKSGYEDSYFIADFGARIPVGLFFQPRSSLEFFLEFAPSIGLMIENSKWLGDSHTYFNVGGGWNGMLRLSEN